MSGQSNILLMTPDASVAASVAEALKGNGYALESARPHTAYELTAHLSRSAPPLVLVDVDPRPGELLPALERIIARFSASRFVALADQVSSELLLDAMGAGLRRVVSKRSINTELHTVLDKLTSSAAQDLPQGEVLTVLSASGGTGATTIAVNLADELAAKTSGQHALLIDMDCCYGAMATYLGLEPRYGLDQVLGYSGSIDPELLSSTATASGHRLDVLASPASIRFSRPGTLDLSRLDEALRSARRAYRHTVVDAPRVSMETAATLAMQSSRTMIVLQLTVKDIRIARAMLDALNEWAVPLSNVLPVVNRYHRRQMIGLDEARKALGGVDVACIRNDYASAITGLNFGKTLEQAAPRSTLRRDLQDLLVKLRQ